MILAKLLGRPMQNLKEVVELISVRNFMSSSIENMRIKLSREEVKDIQNKVAIIDKFILEQSLKFDIAELTAPKNVMTTQYTFQAAEDVEETVKKMSLFREAVGQTDASDPVSWSRTSEDEEVATIKPKSKKK